MRHPPADLLRPETWAKVLNAVDQAVADDPASGFTTFVGFIISGGRLCGTSSGDSAVLLLNPTKPATILNGSSVQEPASRLGGSRVRQLRRHVGLPMEGAGHDRWRLEIRRLGESGGDCN